MVTRGEVWGEGLVRESWMDVSTLPYLRWKTNKVLLLAWGTLLSVMWQHGWEESLGENGYMYMYGWVPLLFTLNYHNTVNQLNSNTEQKELFKKAPDATDNFHGTIQTFRVQPSTIHYRASDCTTVSRRFPYLPTKPCLPATTEERFRSWLIKRKTDKVLPTTCW